jgi:DNA ligase-associated metallophosphoesterase
LLNKNLLETEIHFADEKFILDAAGSLYWPNHKMLIFSDTHFEKGSYLALRGNPLPVYDTLDTLHRIARLISKYQPENVISLGDNMPDGQALTRMAEPDFDFLTTLCTSVPYWYWIIGNHDKADYATSRLSHMQFHTDIIFNNITFTHDLIPTAPYQIIGHYHPKITLKLKEGRVSDKCLVVSNNKILMPAFGSYTGGLDVTHATLKAAIDDDKAKYYFLHKENIWRVK